MRQQVPRCLTVMVDGNEQNDLQFPPNFVWNVGGRCHLIQLKINKRRFDTGDYYLDGYKEVAIVERKGSLGELHTNLFTGDETRFRAALRRMVSATRVPILWLDIPVSQLFEATAYVDDPRKVVDKLLRTCEEFGVRWVWQPPMPAAHARRSGELLVRMLWSIIQFHSKGAKTKPNVVTCVACKEEGFEWFKTPEHGWRLYKDGVMHDCPNYKDKSSFVREEST